MVVPAGSSVVPVHPFFCAQVATVCFAEGSTAVPSYGTVGSASPCTCSTATGFDGLHLDGPSHPTPARLTIAASRDAESQASRCDMYPPLEWQVTNTRFLSMLY